MPLKLASQTTLRAVANRIIPADDFPDAWTAGVGEYLQRQFEGDLQDRLPQYEVGLAALETEAKQQFGADFPALTTAQQDELLRRIEKGEVRANWTVVPGQFFQMLVRHVWEGYYGDMMHRAPVGWQMLNYEERCRRS